MDRGAAFVALAALAAIGYYYGSDLADASTDVNAGDDGGNIWDNPNNPGQDQVPMDSQTKLTAFANTIGQFESNGDYNALVGGGSFSDMSDHPASPSLPAPAGWRLSSGHTNYYNPTYNSSAAGKYQFIYGTWKRLQGKLGLPDFSPASQDAAVFQLLTELGVPAALDAENVTEALRRASSQWASLPYSQAGQHKQSLQAALDAYQSFIG